MSAEDHPSSPVEPAPRKRRLSLGAKIAIALFALMIATVVLAVLALPMLTVRTEGNQARANLTAALADLRSGDVAEASARVAAARADVTAAHAAAHGFRSDVLGFLPIAGGAVDDVRHLVGAVDEAVAVAEVGVELYPSVLGEDATVIQDGVVDLGILNTVAEAAGTVSGNLDQAESDLVAIGASTPVIGAQIGRARDAALEQVTGLQTTLERYRPLLAQMPTVLGNETPVRYLIAVMNSAELRSSGGATLSLGEMVIDQGRITFGDAGSTTDFTEDNSVISWEPVPGNPWHQTPQDKLVNASMSPNWTTSGEELLRAWQVTTGNEAQALIAVDVPALAELFRITGPLEVEGYGTLNGGNLVERLIGSYDDFRNPEQRKRLNEALIPVLRQKLLEGGKFVQKAQSLVESAQGRHVVAYFRDPATQALIAELGLAGDLSTTSQDYLGIFTQNTNASKVDIWQQRSVRSEVTLLADGSADVVTTTTIVNATPPYEQRVEDPKRGYYTRWSLPVYVQYLPMGAQLGQVVVNGEDRTTSVGQVVERDRPFLRSELTLEPGATAEVVVRYRVPTAAVAESGGLRYNLDIDPQGVVNPTTYAVVLRGPEGYVDSTAGEEWTINPDLTLTLEAPPDLGIRTSVLFVPG